MARGNSFWGNLADVFIPGDAYGANGWDRNTTTKGLISLIGNTLAPGVGTLVGGIYGHYNPGGVTGNWNGGGPFSNPGNFGTPGGTFGNYNGGGITNPFDTSGTGSFGDGWTQQPGGQPPPTNLPGVNTPGHIPGTSDHPFQGNTGGLGNRLGDHTLASGPDARTFAQGMNDQGFAGYGQWLGGYHTKVS